MSIFVFCSVLYALFFLTLYRTYEGSTSHVYVNCTVYDIEL